MSTRAVHQAQTASSIEAGAKLLIIVTPRGYEGVYVRGPRGMELVRKGPASYELAPTSFRETMYLNAWSRRQAQVEAVDPAEYVFLVSGRSSLMIGSYNLNESTAKNGSMHHELTIDGWDNDE